jgi:hypothetical protein
MWAWIGVALMVALAAFTVSRLARSWGAARRKLDSADPPRSDPS